MTDHHPAALRVNPRPSRPANLPRVWLATVLRDGLTAGLLGFCILLVLDNVRLRDELVYAEERAEEAKRTVYIPTRNRWACERVPKAKDRLHLCREPEES